MKCTYCLTNLEENEVTRDHVFPDAWYPDSTPVNIQKWTVPACEKCNGKFQKIEDHLFCRWGICMEDIEASAGINARAIGRSSFLGITDSNRFRRKLSVFKGMEFTQYDPKRTHAGTDPKLGVRSALAIKCSGTYRQEFSEKLVKGTELILFKRLIPRRKYIQIHYEMAADPLHEHYKIWEQLIRNGTTINLGPGFAVKGAINTPNYPEQSLYHFEIWGHLKFWAFVNKKTFCWRLRRIWHTLQNKFVELRS